jgi:hypothetical protein
MTSSKPVVKIILIYDRLNLWRHRQYITIFYQFLHIRIEIIHGSHMYVLFLPRVGLYVSFLPLANARGKTSWHKGLPVVKIIYTYGFHELFLKQILTSLYICALLMLTRPGKGTGTSCIQLTNVQISIKISQIKKKKKIFVIIYHDHVYGSILFWQK